MAAPSAFSYAQAAKGKSVPASVRREGPTVPPEAQNHDPATTMPSSQPERPADPSEKSKHADHASTSVVQKDEVPNTASESKQRCEETTERALGEKRDDQAESLTPTWRQVENGTALSSIEPSAASEVASKKTSQDESGQHDEKLPAELQFNDGDVGELAHEAARLEIFEAPIPSVNIWQQRRAAQLAKAKPIPPVAAEPVKTPSDRLPEEPVSIPTDTPQDARKLPSTALMNGTKPQRKSQDLGRPDRNGNRAPRTEKEGKEPAKVGAPPPVEDAAAWPTPESAIKEEKKKSAAGSADRQDKDSKTIADGPAPVKPRQKEKWVAYDYVPSVNFETQLPQLRTSKPRSGARALGSNSNRGSAGPHSLEKTPSNAPTTGRMNDKDRPRQSAAAGSRPISVPPTSKRASIDGSNSSKDQKRSTGENGMEQSRHPAYANAPFIADEARHQDHPSGARERDRLDMRGGYRGRGGHRALGTHTPHQHHQLGNVGYQQSSMLLRSQGLYSPPRQLAYNPVYMPPPPPTRGGRNRTAAGANPNRSSLPNGIPRLSPSVTPQFAPLDYPVPPLTAMPYQPQPYWDNYIMTVLKHQIEYYFSIENLCKDMYLRRRMDSQGFVNLLFVAAFKRIKELTSDMAMIRAVCETSAEIDFVVGDDDVERLRRRVGWQNFVLPMQDRDELARNLGPAQYSFKNYSTFFLPHANGMAAAPYGAAVPFGYNFQSEPYFQPYPGGLGMNGYDPGAVMSHAGTMSQLSAEVPDFSPSGPSMLGAVAAPEAVPPEAQGAANVGAAQHASTAHNGYDSFQGRLNDPAQASLHNATEAPAQPEHEAAQT